MARSHYYSDVKIVFTLTTPKKMCTWKVLHTFTKNECQSSKFNVVSQQISITCFFRSFESLFDLLPYRSEHDNRRQFISQVVFLSTQKRNRQANHSEPDFYVSENV